MDLVSSWTLAFFGTCLGGALVGFVVGKLTDFELGVGVGMLLPGIVSLTYLWTFATEYLDFRDNPSRADGVVVAVEDRPVAGGTTPVAIVEFTAHDGAVHRAKSKAASGLNPDERVTVVYPPNDPSRAKVGRTSDLLGGTVASMLFGTFPTSAGLFYILGWIGDHLPPRKRTRDETERAGKASRLTIAGNLLLFFGLLGGGLFVDDVQDQIMAAFGIVSLGLWIHAFDGVHRGRDPRWTLGMAVLAVNFSAWVVALWLLRPTDSSW
jgi:hypothetical protein